MNRTQFTSLLLMSTMLIACGGDTGAGSATPSIMYTHCIRFVFSRFFLGNVSIKFRSAL